MPTRGAPLPEQPLTRPTLPQPPFGNRSLPNRAVDFRWDEDWDPRWTPRIPEFAAVANAVSLLMPTVEPSVARAVSACSANCEEGLHTQADWWVRQELQHSRQHRRLNLRLLENYPLLRFVQRFATRVYRWVDSRSVDFRISFAAGSEAVAYSCARWTEAHLSLLDGADLHTRQAFLWHLAEEVEHKNVAFDVWQSQRRSRFRLAVATALAMLVLAGFTTLGFFTILATDRQVLRPRVWLNLTRWTFSYIINELPNIASSALPGHHPSQFVDPLFFETVLDSWDMQPADLP